MPKYLCKTKLYEDDDSVSFQNLFVTSNLTATELAYKLSDQAKQCDDEIITDAFGEVCSIEPYYGFKIKEYNPYEAEFIERDSYFRLEVYYYNGMNIWHEIVTQQIEIIKIDDINFIEV